MCLAALSFNNQFMLKLCLKGIGRLTDLMLSTSEQNKLFYIVIWGLLKKKRLKTQTLFLTSPTNTVEWNTKDASQKHRVRDDKKENVTSKLGAIRAVYL